MSRRPRRRLRGVGAIALGAVAVVVTATAGVAAGMALTSYAVEARPVSSPTGGPTPPAPSIDPTPTPTRTPTRTPTPTPTPTEPPPATESPVALPCATSTLVTVWAHTDDDIIFANPAIADAIAAGRCVRSLYLTAGDAGRSEAYYRSRELGILRAYNAMRGQSGALWNQTQLTLLSGAKLTEFIPQNEDRLSILFLRLPDGGLNGKGFPSTHDVSIPQLLDGQIRSIQAVDGGKPLSRALLEETVAEVVGAFGPAEVYTHVPRGASAAQGDHPDHSATGTLVRLAANGVDAGVVQVRYFVGYPSAGWDANVQGDALVRKVDVYRIYAKEDPVIACETNEKCLEQPHFGAWLQRSWSLSDAQLGID